MGKIWQIYEQLLPNKFNMSEIGMFQCSEVEEQGLSQLLSCRYAPIISFPGSQPPGISFKGPTKAC